MCRPGQLCNTTIFELSCAVTPHFFHKEIFFPLRFNNCSRFLLNIYVYKSSENPTSPKQHGVQKYINVQCVGFSGIWWRGCRVHLHIPYARGSSLLRAAADIGTLPFLWRRICNVPKLPLYSLCLFYPFWASVETWRYMVDSVEEDSLPL